MFRNICSEGFEGHPSIDPRRTFRPCFCRPHAATIFCRNPGAPRALTCKLQLLFRSGGCPKFGGTLLGVYLLIRESPTIWGSVLGLSFFRKPPKCSGTFWVFQGAACQVLERGRSLQRHVPWTAASRSEWLRVQGKFYMAPFLWALSGGTLRYFLYTY